MVNKLVSVIIPTYKNRGGLKKSIDSVLSQNYAPFEVIVVDDNDPDSSWRKNTEAIMDEFISDHRVVYVKHETNKNGAAARNTGIKISKGEFIAFLDDDDVFLPNKLVKQIDYIDSNPDVQCVYCLARKNGKDIKTDPYEGDVTEHLLLEESHMFTPSLLFKADAIKKIKGFDEFFYRHQDYDLLLRFFKEGYKIGCLREVLIEIGSNQGENIPNGENLNNIKSYFFMKFGPYINDIDKVNKGYYNKVYVRHYTSVFLNHIKNKNYSMAFITFKNTFFKSPIEFIYIIFNHIHLHLVK